MFSAGYSLFAIYEDDMYTTMAKGMYRIPIYIGARVSFDVPPYEWIDRESNADERSARIRHSVQHVLRILIANVIRSVCTHL